MLVNNIFFIFIVYRLSLHLLLRLGVAAITYNKHILFLDNIITIFKMSSILIFLQLLLLINILSMLIGDPIWFKN